MPYSPISPPVPRSSAGFSSLSSRRALSGPSAIEATTSVATPLSRTLYVGASLSADFVGGGYADEYFSILPADSLASGLRTFDADGGYKGWKAGLLVNQCSTYAVQPEFGCAANFSGNASATAIFTTVSLPVLATNMAVRSLLKASPPH